MFNFIFLIHNPRLPQHTIHTFLILEKEILCIVIFEDYTILLKFIEIKFMFLELYILSKSTYHLRFELL